MLQELKRILKGISKNLVASFSEKWLGVPNYKKEEGEKNPLNHTHKL